MSSDLTFVGYILFSGAVLKSQYMTSSGGRTEIQSGPPTASISKRLVLSAGESGTQKSTLAPAGFLSWLGCCPMHRTIWVRAHRGGNWLVFFSHFGNSLSLSLPPCLLLFLSLKSIKIHPWWELKNKNRKL